MTSGERRLNVAVTRARRELKVFSGLRADDIDLSRNKAVGVAHLKAKFSKPGKYQVRAVVRTISSDNYSSSASRVVAVKIKR